MELRTRAMYGLLAEPGSQVFDDSRISRCVETSLSQDCVTRLGYDFGEIWLKAETVSSWSKVDNIGQLGLAQLNGINGEYTNTDDMAEINAANKRRHLEAQTSLYSKPVVNQTNPERAAWRIGRHQRKADIERRQEANSRDIIKEEEKEETREIQTMESPPPDKGCISFHLCGGKVYVVPVGSFRITETLDETQFELVSGDMQPLILNKDKVSYNLRGKHLVRVPQVIVEKTLPGFNYKNVDGTIITKDYSCHSIFLPLYRLLQSFWQMPVYSLSVETAIRNYVLKALAESSIGLGSDQYFELESIFMDTVRFYVFRIIAHTQGIDLVQNKAPLKNAHSVFKTAWYNNYNVEQTGTYIKMNVKARHLPRLNDSLTFDVRPNIAISNTNVWSKEWTIPYSKFFEDTIAWDYNPSEVLSDSELSKQYVSVGMDLIPGCWDHSDVNDTRSLLDAVQKRLFSARDNEQELWLNQQRWLADIASRYGPAPRKVRELLNYEVEERGGVWRLIKDPYWGEVDVAQHRPPIYPDFVVLDEWTVQTTRIKCEATSPVMDFVSQFYYDTSRIGPGIIKDYLNTAAHNVVEGVFTLYALGYSTFVNRYEYARLPGPKRQERMRTLDGVMYEPKTGVCQPIIALKAELDKLNFEKASRVFMSYGPKSSFLAPDLISVAKKRISGRISKKYRLTSGIDVTIDCYTLTTPRTSDIEHLFKEMIDIDKTPNTIIFGCFSDDSVIAWNLPSGMGYANVDISSCDSSNGPLIFELVYRFLSQLDAESAMCYLQQCKQKIRCENPQNRSQYFNISFPTCFEGSGTALTTLLNTIASALICAGIAEVLILEPDLEFGECIKRGAALVGHKVTVDHCKHRGQYAVEKIQFLKFSPIRTTTGMYVPSRNIGCIVRGLGKIVGDLTPLQLGLTATSQEWKLMSAREKFHLYICNIVAGYKNEASHPLLDGLRAQFASKQAVDSKYTQYLEVDGDYSSQTLDPSSLLVRYDVDYEVLMQSRAVCSELCLGSVVQYPLFYEAMVVDYGMERREASPTLGSFSNAGVSFRLTDSNL